MAAGALALVSACGAESDSTTGHEAMSGAPAAATTASAQPSVTFNDADVIFAQMMIPHHEQAVETAELAASRAADPEVKELAARIEAAQDPEIQTLKGWLAEWGKPVPSGGMGHDMPGVMTEEEMAELEAAKGTAFDRLFARLMVVHHEGAIEMARTEQADGANAQAKELAKTIESTQRAEVKELRTILDRL
ncbi:DUF305 domain-containing protein [Nonomuraea sp. NPDC050643]|uniref:DUF305 domain-containing protein n=1 Tax=Nonomuraea sp. NPDC050643 TaxID=3155660 RepID=UPI0033C6802E